MHGRSEMTIIDPFQHGGVGVFRGQPNYQDIETAIRKALKLAGLQGAKPLENLIRPGDRVLLKPNLIRESHATRPDEWEQVITHGAFIRAMSELVAEALCEQGSITIADGPQTDSNFEEICTKTGLLDIANHVRKRGVRCDVLDLRRDRWFQKGDVIYRRVRLPGDPAGYTTVDLGKSSEFSSYQLNGRFYGADYDMEETSRFHNPQRHAYVLCRSVLDADVVINLPKLKTHKKTGITISLKNLVGVNGLRNCLPHFSVGTSGDGGDEFPSTNRLRSRFQSRAIIEFKRILVRRGMQGGRTARLVKRVGKTVFGDTNQVVRSGNWHGNDTVWRMVLDLNKILFYFNGSGERRKRPLRYLSVVDGIIAGDGNGPMAPDPNFAGLVIAGFNPLAVDSVSALLMGFDDEKIPLLAGGWRIAHYPLTNFTRNAVRCASNVDEWNGTLEDLGAAPHLSMKPHFGWRGKIERTSPAAVGARTERR